MNSSSIRNRLLVFILLISLIPLAIMGYFGYSSTKHLIYEREEEKLQSFFENIEGKLVKFFCNTEKDIKFLGEVMGRELQSYNNTGDYDRIKEIRNVFFHFSKNNIQYNQVKFIDIDGFERIRVNNVDGKPYMVSDSRLKYMGYRYFDREVFKLEKGEIYVTDISLDREDGELNKPLKPVVSYITPVYADDEVQGFIVLHLDTRYILRDIENVKRTNKYDNLMIVDENGYYIMHPNKDKQWGSQKDLNTGEKLQKDYPEIHKNIISTKSMTIQRNESDIIAWTPINIRCFENDKFTLFIEIKKDDYLAPLIIFRNLFLIVLLATFGLLLIVGSITSRYFTKPILRILKAVSHIGKGEFDIDFKVSTGDELELLANEIKDMSYELKNMYTNMEDLVDERTKELQKTKVELEKMAIKDSLTGLYNRHYFNEHIDKLADKAVKEDNHLIIVIIDVDKFKYINDTYGHNVGDIVLKDVARILEDSSRDDDIVVRYGGDEFLVAIYGVAPCLIHKYVDRVKDRVKEYNKTNTVLNHDLTLSIGYDEYEGTREILEVINNADKMMYQNKIAKKKERQS